MTALSKTFEHPQSQQSTMHIATELTHCVRQANHSRVQCSPLSFRRCNDLVYVTVVGWSRFAGDQSAGTDAHTTVQCVNTSSKLLKALTRRMPLIVQHHDQRPANRDICASRGVVPDRTIDYLFHATQTRELHCDRSYPCVPLDSLFLLGHLGRCTMHNASIQRYWGSSARRRCKRS